MKRLRFIVFFWFLAFRALVFAGETSGVTVSAEVYFSPKGGATETIVREISAAKKHPRAGNFTKAAEERNAENMLVLSGTEIARKYLDNWQLHQAHSKELQVSSMSTGPSVISHRQV